MAPLLTSIALHAGLGIVLAGLVRGVGLGWRGGEALAYPAGLLTVIAGAYLVLLTPWLWLAVAPALLVLLVRAPLPAWRPLALPLVAALPFPVALGLLLHGPTD